MAMCGGIIVALIVGDNDPGFVHNGALAGLVAVCAGSDVMHPIGSLVVGGVAGVIFVQMFQVVDQHAGRSTTCSACGRCTGCAACGAASPAASSDCRCSAAWAASRSPRSSSAAIAGAAFGFVVGIVVYGVLKLTVGIRLTAEEEHRGADLSIHKISANPEEDVRSFGS